MDASVGGLSIETFDVFQTRELEITQFHFGLESKKSWGRNCGLKDVAIIPG